MKYLVNFLSSKQEEGTDVAHETDGADDEDEEAFKDVAEAVVRELPRHDAAGGVNTHAGTEM